MILLAVLALQLIILVSMDTEERTRYFKAYNEARPNLVVRLGSAATKDALKLEAAAAGQQLSRFVVGGLIDWLLEKETQNANLA